MRILRAHPSLVALTTLVCVGCHARETSVPVTQDAGEKAAEQQITKRGARPSPTAHNSASVAEDFAAAILDGKRKADISAQGEKGGLGCQPSTLATMTNTLTITLPQSRDARDNILAVLTPERGVYAIYYPYDLEEPSEDYVIPSDQIDWKRASAETQFTVQPQWFDGMKVGTQDRFQIFLENGSYRFALLRNVAPENADRIRAAENVVATCMVDYRGS